MKNYPKTRQIIMLLFAFIVTTTAWSQQTKEERAQKEIAGIMEKTKSVGLSVAVVKDGKIIYNQSFGKKNIESGTNIANDDIFRIASISKSFTTTALMTLLDKKKINLDEDVSNLVGFRVRNPKFPDVKITVKMLLSHTSSLNDSEGYFSLDVMNSDKNKNFANCYNNYAPGTSYEYCNLGFNTIGAIVEKLSGERFDNYVRRVVLKPLGLDAGFNVDSLDSKKFVTLYNYEPLDTTKGSPNIFREQPSAYVSRAKEITSGYKMGVSTPLFSSTGGMKISANGLARYMMMHMNYGKDPMSGKRIISKKSSKLMQAPVIETSPGETYGMSLRQSTKLIPGEIMTGHTGSAYGLYSAMFFQPEKGFGIVMMTNGCQPVYKDGFVTIQLETIRALYNIFIAE
jgi:CubicO group peptidase (beta-lactamase class C family)